MNKEQSHFFYTQIAVEIVYIIFDKSIAMY